MKLWVLLNLQLFLIKVESQKNRLNGYTIQLLNNLGTLLHPVTQNKKPPLITEAVWVFKD
jgi:hypothetical protein